MGGWRDSAFKDDGAPPKADVGLGRRQFRLDGLHSSAGGSRKLETWPGIEVSGGARKPEPGSWTGDVAGQRKLPIKARDECHGKFDVARKPLNGQKPGLGPRDGVREPPPLRRGRAFGKGGPRGFCGARCGQGL